MDTSCLIREREKKPIGMDDDDDAWRMRWKYVSVRERMYERREGMEMGQCNHLLCFKV